MKVLLLNGSPKANGNTAAALAEMVKIFGEEGIEAEVVQVGHLGVRGCIACGSCHKTGKCVFDDVVNDIADKFREADGLVAASPVYYASANANDIICGSCRIKFYFLARVRMVCMPSSSRTASPGAPPWTEFQYWLEATGMPLMVKYLFSWSKVAEQPPRLATATDAPTFMRLSKWALKKSRSSTAMRVALAEA